MYFLVDGTNLVHRAFTAISGPRLDRTADPGIVANTAAGFIRHHLRDLRKQGRTALTDQRVLVAMDGARASEPRRRIDPSYKAQRMPKPPQLLTALAAFQTLVLAADWTIRVGPILEADDQLALAARDITDQGDQALIFTSDRDLLQCITDRVGVLIYHATPRTAEVWDYRRFRLTYGFAPSALADWKALAGDQSDGITGVAGIGVVTAGRLLSAYGDLEGIDEHLDDILPLRIQTIVRRGMDRAYHLRQITRLPFLEPVAPETLFDDPADQRATDDQEGIHVPVR